MLHLSHFGSTILFVLLSSPRIQGFFIQKLLKMGGKSSKPEYDENMYNQPIEGVTLQEKILEFNGRRINVSRWSPASPKAVIFVSHGLHEHGMRYWNIAESLTAKNYLVVALDHASHGLSQGDRGLITDYTLLPKDFVSLAKSVHEEYPNLPCFILAHSMGTLVATLSVAELPFVKAIVFSGCPIVSGPASSSPFGVQCLYPLSQTSAAVSITRFMAFLAPKGAAAPIILAEISSDLDELEILKKDSRRYDGDIMNKTAYEVIKMIQAVKTEVLTLKTPFICLHGSDDKVALPASSSYLIQHSATAPSKKSVVFFPKLKHEIFHEKKPEGPGAILRAVEYFETQYALKADETV